MSVTDTMSGVGVTVCEERSKEKMYFSQCQQEMNLEEAAPVYLLMERTGSGSSSC